MNIVCLGGKVIVDALAWDLIETFLAARFSGAPRHRRRLAEIKELENPLIGRGEVRSARLPGADGTQEETRVFRAAAHFRPGAANKHLPIV